MSRYKKIAFLITLGLVVLFLIGWAYGYYNYRYYLKWQVMMVENVLRAGGYTAMEDASIDKLGVKKEHYLHLAQIFGLLVVGVMVSGTLFVFAIDLMKRDKKD